MLSIGTHNVNGIRAAQRRGFTEWITNCQPDLLAVQEVRCPINQLPTDAFGDFHTYVAPGKLAGRNGVAIVTKHPVSAIRSWGSETYSINAGQITQLDPAETRITAFPIPEELDPFEDEGRFIEIDLADSPLTVGCLYLPKGGLPENLNTKPGRNGLIDPKSPAKYARKMSFLTGFAKYLVSARSQALQEGREYLVMGDFNIAHTQQDLKNWRANQKSEGFLPEERDWFSSILGEEKLLDVVREQAPDEDGPYSWWSWMGQSFAKDVGWRIDYHLASSKLAAASDHARVLKEASAAARMSDHSPVFVDYEIG